MTYELMKKLPEDVVEAGTIRTYEKHLDLYMNKKRFRGLWVKCR